jgi:hypothetical protein
VILTCQQRNACAWAEERFAFARLTARERIDLEPQLALEPVEVADGGGVVAVETDEEGPRGAVAAVDARGPLELRSEGRPTSGRRDGEGQTVLFAVAHLGDRREHARGHVGRSRPRVRVDDRDPSAGSGRRTSTGQTDQPPADDHDVGGHRGSSVGSVKGSVPGEEVRSLTPQGGCRGRW